MKNKHMRPFLLLPLAIMAVLMPFAVAAAGAPAQATATVPAAPVRVTSSASTAPSVNAVVSPAGASATAMPDIPNMVVAEKGPENLKAEAKSMKIFLSWDNIPGQDTAYNIYRSISATADFLKINKEEIKTNSYVDDRDSSLIAPQSGYTYYYKVSSVESGKESGDSNVASAAPYGELVAPDRVVITPRFSAVNLKWEEPESWGKYDLTGYNVYRATEAGAFLRVNQGLITAFEYDDAGLTNGARYLYELQSVDSAGNTSAFSKSFEARPFSSVSAPKNVTTSPASSESVKVAWDAPDGAGTFGISGYNIYRTTVPGTFAAKPLNERLIREYKDADGRNIYFDNMINSSEKPEAGFTYYYKLVPVDMMGNTGAASDPVTGAISVLEVSKSGLLTHDISEYGLPPESRLTLSGRKTLKLSYEHIWWNSHRTVSTNSENFDITQKLRLNLNGNIGTKINVDVKYDEDMPSDEYTKISIKYSGDKEETLQEVSFGDMSLDFPATRYVSYSQTLFGIKAKIRVGDKLSFTAIGAQTKGITDIQTFVGNLRQKQVNGNVGTDIADTGFVQNVYYYITKDPAVTIKPGSIVIYRDDRTAYDNDANTVYSTPTSSFAFDLLRSGVDYTVDYVNKVIKFTVTIANSYAIAVGYQQADGTMVGLKSDGSFDFSETALFSDPNGFTNPTAHLIQNGVQSGTIAYDISHRVECYYSMGDTQIYNPLIDPDFKLYVEAGGVKGAKVTNVPVRPSDPGAGDYYEIDTDFGILKFKSPFPFAVGQPVAYPPYNNTTGQEADAYNINAGQQKSLYNIHIEYKYYVTSYKLDHSPVVYGSERIYIGGRLLRKDTDYYIFYETGDVSFIDKNLVQPTSEIKIVYEYFPFLQTFQSNLFGTRMDYQLLDNFKIGGTWLYKSSSSGTTIPDARSTETALSSPYSSWILDGDMKLDLSRENFNAIINAIPGVEKANLPVDFKFQGEMAYSDFNPNIFDRNLDASTTEHGVAMIDNMEGADNVISTSMTKEKWFPASLPDGCSAGNRVYFTKTDVSEAGHAPTDASNPLASSTTTMLKLQYSGITNSNWDAFRYVLSSTGESLNQYNYLEMWVYVDTDNPVRLTVDVGIVNEDSNGNGAFSYNTYDTSGNLIRNDSEDVYPANGVFTTDKDTGIGSGIYPSNPDYWGANNNTLDTEDMNGNGRLDMEEDYYRYNPAQMVLSGHGGWTNIKIPLKQFSSFYGTVNTDITSQNFMSLIKHVRISIKGDNSAPSTGTVKIESLEFTGNSWRLQVLQLGTAPYNYPAPDPAGNPATVDNNKMDILSINKNTDTTYTPNLSFYDWQTESDKNYEEALKVYYNLSISDEYNGAPIYFAKKTLNSSGGSGYDYHAYKNLKLDVYYAQKDTSAGPGRIMFIRMGSGSDENIHYYQFNEFLDDIPSDSAWHTVTFAMDGSDNKRGTAVGNPNLRQIQWIVIGFINPHNVASEEILYLNNLRLTDPDPKRGTAAYASSTLNVIGFGTLSHDYEEKNSDFFTLADAGRADIKQHYLSNAVTFNYNQITFLPVNNRYQKTELYTDTKYRNDLSYTRNNQLPDTVSEGYTNSVSFSLIPDLSLNNYFSMTTNWTEYFGIQDYTSLKSRTVSIKPGFTWRAPALLFNFIPLGANTLEGSVSYNDINNNYFKPTTQTALQGVYYDNWRLDRLQDYKWTGVYNIWNVSLQPSYEQKIGEEKGNLSSNFVYYQNLLLDLHNRVDDYVVLNREIYPKLIASLKDAWIFSPMITYAEDYRMDYTNSQLRNHGKLDFSTGVKISSLLSFLPDISTYSFSVDNTGQYDNRVYPDSFGAFEAQTFERKWNLFLWNLLGSENEMQRLESLAYSGAFVINHTLNLSEIKVLGRFGVTPSMSYQYNRTFSNQGAVRSFSDVINVTASNFYISGITVPVPILQDYITDQRISGSYSYSRTVTRDSNKSVITDTIDNRLQNLSISFSVKDGVNGTIGVSASWQNVYRSLVSTFTNSITPTFVLNYNLKQTSPITIPGWIPLIGDKVFKFEQVVNLSLALAVTKSISGGTGNNDLNKADTDVYTATGSAGYNVLQNLKITLELLYTHKEDKLVLSNSMDSIKISLGGEIEF